MSVRVLRAADHRAMPWKNGGGTTWEVAISPAGASLDDFDWRISMARVETDGPFSAFPGVDRGFAVLEGEGIALAVGGAAAAELRPGDPPFAFSADLPTAARLLGGPITDLNVMTRRARFSQELRRVDLVAGQRLDLPDSGGLLLLASGELAAAGEVLGPRDALLADEAAGARALSAAEVFAVLLRRT